MIFTAKNGLIYDICMATQDDIEQLVLMRLEYIKEDFKESDGDKINRIKESLPSYFMKHLNKDLMAFTARYKNSIVATVLLTIEERPANPEIITGKKGTLLNVLTQREHRHQGLGEILVNEAIKYAHVYELAYIGLSATEEGYGLYKKVGFRDTVPSHTEMRFDIN